MAEVTKGRTGQFVRKLFEILKREPEGMRAADALAALASSVQLTDYEAGEYDSGGRRFEKIVRFATVDCVKAGWLVKEKGVWSVSAPTGSGSLSSSRRTTGSSLRWSQQLRPVLFDPRVGM